MTQIDWTDDFHPARAPRIDLVRLTTWLGVAAICTGFWGTVIWAVG